MRDLDVALVIDLVEAAVEDDFCTIELGDGAFLLVPQLIDKLTQAFVVVEISFIVAHVRIKFDFLLMLEDGSLLPLILDGLQLFLQFLVFTLATADFLLAHRLLLVNLLIVVLILHAGVLLEGPPLILQLGNLFTKTVTIHSEPLSVLVSVRELSA